MCNPTIWFVQAEQSKHGKRFKRAALTSAATAEASCSGLARADINETGWTGDGRELIVDGAAVEVTVVIP